jgi:hypothetical protein
MMISFFKGVFFKFYYWFKRLDLDNIPEYTAISGLTILVSFNILTVLIFVNYLLHRSTKPPVTKVEFGALGLLIWGLFYLYFIRNGRHVEIFKAYSKSTWNRSTGSFLVIFYVLLSILSFISLIWLG